MPEILPSAEGFPTTAVLNASVHRVLGLNPSPFTGPGTNTYLVGMDGPEPLLIDTGSGLEPYRDLLTAHLRRHGAPLPARVLLTHVHADHIGGVAHLRELLPAVQVYKFPWPGKDEAYPGPLHPIADGQVFSGPDYHLRAVHCPGHAQDHICFLLEEERAVFTGDVILGVGTTVIPQDGGNLADYLASLHRLAALAPGRIYPGHGPVIEDGPRKIAEYLAHRLERERQILGELGEGPKTIEEVVRSIYRDYPERLYGAAGQSVLSHLQKLENEGRVRREEGAALLFFLTA